MEQVQKKCTKCEELKELHNFSKFYKSKDGYKAWCKPCSKNYMKNYRENNPEYRLKEREYALRREKQPEVILQNLTKAIEKCKINNIDIPNFSEISN